jgi:NAD(P)-dependent dehydrogenase (short-subunit alcohol dehydrogenase family)
VPGLLDNRVAIVTGAAKGLGAAIARAYGAAGASVVVSDLDEAGAQQVAGEIDGASAIACDVRSEEQVAALVEHATDRHGALHVMVANAGIGSVAPLVQMDLDTWHNQLAVSLDGVFLSIKHAAPAIIASGGGAIVNMGSITALAGAPLLGHYAAAKAGVVSLTKTAALELRDHGVRVNAICPGFADTDLVSDNLRALDEGLGMPIMPIIERAQGRLGTPQDVANLAVFLASERSRFATGSAFVCDGGAMASLV